MDSSSMMSSNVSLYENELKFYFVVIDGIPTDEFNFAREVSANQKITSVAAILL